MKKVCSKCDAEKDVSEFHKDQSRKDGLYIRCKECRSKAEKQYRLDNFEKIKEHRKDEYQKRKEFHKQYYQKNAKKRSEYYKVYYQNKADKLKENSKRYWRNNKDKIIERRKKKLKSLITL